MADRVFNEAHRLAHDNPKFAQLFNLAVGDDLGISSHDSITELNKKFPELASNEAFKKIEKMFADGQVSKATLLELFRQQMATVQKQYGPIHAELKGLKKQQEELQASTSDILRRLEGPSPERRGPRQGRA